MLQEIIGALDAAQLVQRTVMDHPTIQPGYVFTGIGLRQGGLHLGHHVLLQLMARISRAGIPVLIQIANDQKRYTTPPLRDRGELQQITRELWIALSRYRWGAQVYVVDNLRDEVVLQPVANYLNSTMTLSKMATLFGRDYDVYRAAYTGRQLAPMVLYHAWRPNHVPWIISADDQLPFFLAMRDLAPKMGIKKPQIVLLNPLKDIRLQQKMSSSRPRRAVLMNAPRRIIQAISGKDHTDDFCMHTIHYLRHMQDSSWNMALQQGHNLQLKHRLIAYLQHRPVEGSPRVWTQCWDWEDLRHKLSHMGIPI